MNPERAVSCWNMLLHPADCEMEVRAWERQPGMGVAACLACATLVARAVPSRSALVSCSLMLSCPVHAAQDVMHVFFDAGAQAWRYYGGSAGFRRLRDAPTSSDDEGEPGAPATAAEAAARAEAAVSGGVLLCRAL